MPNTPALLHAAEAAWAAVRVRHCDLPAADAAIAYVPQRGPCGQQVFALARLKARAGLPTGLEAGADGDSPVHLAVNRHGVSDADEAMADVLHQAAHILAKIRRLEDTGSAGRYHRREFGLLAEELGLHAEIVSNRGWMRTILLPHTAAMYRDNLNELRAASQPPVPRTTNGNYLVARCSCPRRIRVAPGIFRQAPIHCTGCGADFESQSA